METYVWFIIIGVILGLVTIGFIAIENEIAIVTGGMSAFLLLGGLLTVFAGGEYTGLKTYQSQQGPYCYTIHPNGEWENYAGECVDD